MLMHLNALPATVYRCKYLSSDTAPYKHYLLVLVGQEPCIKRDQHSRVYNSLNYRRHSNCYFFFFCFLLFLHHKFAAPILDLNLNNKHKVADNIGIAIDSGVMFVRCGVKYLDWSSPLKWVLSSRVNTRLNIVCYIQVWLCESQFRHRLYGMLYLYLGWCSYAMWFDQTNELFTTFRICKLFQWNQSIFTSTWKPQTSGIIYLIWV